MKIRELYKKFVKLSKRCDKAEKLTAMFPDEDYYDELFLECYKAEYEAFDALIKELVSLTNIDRATAIRMIDRPEFIQLMKGGD